MCLKVFYFCKILKMREKILWNPQTFFVFVLYCTKRRCSQIKPQLKVQIEDGREEPLKPNCIETKTENNQLLEAFLIRPDSLETFQGYWCKSYMPPYERRVIKIISSVLISLMANCLIVERSNGLLVLSTIIYSSNYDIIINTNY